MTEPKVLTVAEVAEIKENCGQYDAWEHCQEVLVLCFTIEVLRSGLKPAEQPTIEELIKIWTDTAMSEDAQRCANATKDWNAERAIGIRAMLAHCGVEIADAKPAGVVNKQILGDQGAEQSDADRKVFPVEKDKPVQNSQQFTDTQIKHMVDRFLNWRLPDNFNPDAGISFKRICNEGTRYQFENKPVGTNLFDAVQAEEMVRNMVDGIASPVEKDQAERGPAQSEAKGKAMTPEREAQIREWVRHWRHHIEEDWQSELLAEWDRLKAAERQTREALASWMIARGFATGHGDTHADLLAELGPQIDERAEKLAESERIRYKLEDLIWKIRKI